jgi:hypothetical protein
MTACDVQLHPVQAAPTPAGGRISTQGAGVQTGAFPPEHGAGIGLKKVGGAPARWSDRFSMGPLPVTMACTKKPNMENMARRPFLISLICDAAQRQACQLKLAQSPSNDEQLTQCHPERGLRVSTNEDHQQTDSFTDVRRQRCYHTCQAKMLL